MASYWSTTGAGQLDQRIALQRLTRIPDGGGGYAEDWQTYATVWAYVRPMSGRERYQAQQLEAAANYRITIRYRADIDPADRILWRGKILNIRFIANAGPRDLYLTLDAEIER